MKFIYPLLVLSTLTLALPQNVLAIGQLTKPIVIEDVLRGQEVTDTLILFNSEEDEADYGLQAEGEIAQWASFYNIEDQDQENSVTTIKIPAKSSIDATVKFSIPEDTPNGTYQGQVVFFSIPKEGSNDGQNGASVFQRVGREVSITVTDQEVVRLETTVIPESYDVEQDGFLRIKLIHENFGNISLSLDVELKIIQEDRVIYDAIFPYPEDQQPVKPRERKTMPLIEWSVAGKDSGSYRAYVSILRQGEVLSEDDFRFTIGYKKNFVFGKLLAAIGFLGGGSQVAGWFTLAGIIIILAAIFFFLAKRQVILAMRKRK